MPDRRAPDVTVVLAFAFALALTGSLGAVPAAAGAGGPSVDVSDAPGEATAATTTPATPSTGANATIVAAYPNPVAEGDAGEFVAIRFSQPTDATDWTLTDGKTTARLPNRTLEGTVAVSTAPAAARENTDRRVAALDGRLHLANGGDRLELRRDGESVHAVRYRDAPESRVRDFEARRWRPVGATDREPVRTGGGEATAFVLPDAPDRTVETLRSADDRLLLAGYTLTSERVTDALLAAHRDGATVRVHAGRRARQRRHRAAGTAARQAGRRRRSDAVAGRPPRPLPPPPPQVRRRRRPGARPDS